jgi:hypothetical protein
MTLRRLFLLLFFAYVGLDLGSPMVPGAFSFDPDDSVDAVAGDRARPASLPRVASVPASVALIRPLVETAAPVSAARAVPLLVAWRPHASLDRAAGPQPRASAEDD